MAGNDLPQSDFSFTPSGVAARQYPKRRNRTGPYAELTPEQVAERQRRIEEREATSSRKRARVETDDGRGQDGHEGRGSTAGRTVSGEGQGVDAGQTEAGSSSRSAAPTGNTTQPSVSDRVGAAERLAFDARLRALEEDVRRGQRRSSPPRPATEGQSNTLLRETLQGMVGSNNEVAQAMRAMAQAIVDNQARGGAAPNAVDMTGFAEQQKTLLEGMAGQQAALIEGLTTAMRSQAAERPTPPEPARAAVPGPRRPALEREEMMPAAEAKAPEDVHQNGQQIRVYPKFSRVAFTEEQARLWVKENVDANTYQNYKDHEPEKTEVSTSPYDHPMLSGPTGQRINNTKFASKIGGFQHSNKWYIGAGSEISPFQDMMKKQDPQYNAVTAPIKISLNNDGTAYWLSKISQNFQGRTYFDVRQGEEDLAKSDRYRLVELEDHKFISNARGHKTHKLCKYFYTDDPGVARLAAERWQPVDKDTGLRGPQDWRERGQNAVDRPYGERWNRERTRSLSPHAR